MMVPALFLRTALLLVELSNPYRDYCYADEMVLIQEDHYVYPVGRPGARFHQYEVCFRSYWGDSDFSPYFDFYFLTPRKALIDQAVTYRGRKYWNEVSLVCVPWSWNDDYMIWKIKVRDPENELDTDSPIRIEIWSSLIIPKTQKEIDEEGRIINENGA